MERVKRNIVTIHILLAAILMLLTTCKRDERDNPWDKFAAINPDTWAPKAVQTSNIDITKHEVAWTYEGDNRIEGFRIDRKEGNSEWEIGVFTAEKDDRSWIDTNVIPDTTLTYTYKVYAIAGDNKSSNIIASIDVEFPAPTSIDIEKISDISYKLSWADNSIGEQGFKIDRRTDGSEWQIAHGTVEANQTAYTDNTVDFTINTNYLYRVYAFYEQYNSEKIEVNIGFPEISTTSVSNITANTASSGGNVINSGGANVTARGVVWSITENPTINSNQGITSKGTGTGTFTSNLTNLQPLTTYYIRAYATNSVGTQYGNQVFFTTLHPDGPGETITDADGNTYNTIWINGRQWMKENLKTTKYNDGTPIPTGHSNAGWAALTTGAYAVYPHASIDGLNSDAEVLEAYGALYNWFAVETCNLCPSGWRVPTYAEWTALTDYAGGASVAGGKLKSTRTVPDAHPRWASPNEGATDEYGFSALPGGGRSYDGPFFYFDHNCGYWWSSTEDNTDYAWLRSIFSDYSSVGKSNYYKELGLSVRCYRDL